MKSKAFIRESVRFPEIRTTATTAMNPVIAMNAACSTACHELTHMGALYRRILTDQTACAVDREPRADP